MGLENNKQRIGSNCKIEDIGVTVLQGNRRVLGNLDLPNEAEPIMFCFDFLVL
jgi:hypothetical protein